MYINHISILSSNLQVPKSGCHTFFETGHWWIQFPDWFSSDTLCMLNYIFKWINQTRFSVTVNFANKAVYQPVTYMRLGRLSSILTIIGVWILSVAICIPAAIDIETNFCYCTIKPTHFNIRWLEVIKFELLMTNLTNYGRIGSHCAFSSNLFHGHIF